jgi:peptide/nickel transport system substrate-binding protein
MSLERELTLAGDWLPGYLDGIAGASRCRAAPKRCHLRGVETNDRAGTVTIRLTEPDPDFLHKLTLSFAYVLQGGGPRVVGPHSAPVGTGPYRTVRTTRRRFAALVRNERFVATDGRPAGFVDAVDVRFNTSSGQTARLDAALEGRADIASMPRLTQQRDRDRASRYPWRIVRSPIPHTELFFLNTSVPPFDDVRVRRALNFAIDRKRLVRTVGGPAVAEIACQLLPPGMPGREPRCPWTLDPRPGGGWRAPDLARARRLVAHSATRGMRVTVHVPPGLGSGPEIAAALRRLGYRAGVREYKEWDDYGQYVNDHVHKVQAGWSGWVADYLAPAGFLSELVTCAARPPAGSNHSQYCDARLDRDIALAAAGHQSWKPALDRIENQALTLPLWHGRTTAVTSERVGNVQSHTLNGLMLEGAWVQ